MTDAITKFGPYAYYANGVGFASFPIQGSEFTFGTGDFTVEFWIYFTSLSGAAVSTIWTCRSDANAASQRPQIYITSANKLAFFSNGSDNIVGGTTLTTGTWHFVALSRVSGSTRMYLNTAQEGSTYTDSNSYLVPTAVYFMGAIASGSPVQPVTGLLEDVRITKGVGRYTGASITVPTAPFPNY